MPILYLAVVGTIIGFGIQNVAQKYNIYPRSHNIKFRVSFGSFFSNIAGREVYF